MVFVVDKDAEAVQQTIIIKRLTMIEARRDAQAEKEKPIVDANCWMMIGSQVLSSENGMTVFWWMVEISVCSERKTLQLPVSLLLG